MNASAPTSPLHVESAQLPKVYPLQLGLAYLLLVGYLARTLFVSLNLPASVGVILTGWSFSYFIQDDIFYGRDMLQELAFFLVLLTAGLGISISSLKTHLFVLAWLPATLELLAIAAFASWHLGFTLAEGLNLGTVLVGIGDGLVIPKMKEFSCRFPQHPMPYLMLCWAPLEASFALTLFGVFTAVSAPASMPDLNILVLIFLTCMRIAATVVVGAFLGKAAGYLIHHRKEVKLFGQPVFLNQPVEAFLMLLSVALCAYGLGSPSRGNPISMFGLGPLFQAELMVIVTGSTFADYCDEHCADLLLEVEVIMGGVWVFGQLVLFSMLGSKTSASVFPNLVTVLPIMGVGLLARFIGVLAGVIGTRNDRGVSQQGMCGLLADAFFCFLACLPRATIQGALGAVPVNQRFFQDVAEQEDRSEAREFIFTAARLYIFCMSIFGMFMLNTFGPKMLEAGRERPAEEDFLNSTEIGEPEPEVNGRVADAAKTLGKEFHLEHKHVLELLGRPERHPAQPKLLSKRTGSSFGLQSVPEAEAWQDLGVQNDTPMSSPTHSMLSMSKLVEDDDAGFLRGRAHSEPISPPSRGKPALLRRHEKRMEILTQFESRGLPDPISDRPQENEESDEGEERISRTLRAQSAL
ncbi:unnamed protein product [Effrenium voratum]|uniref:Uncharacterized protein n=1 Tax=Effrenium voratum TaxID=2562239 RepID=A0AA36MJ94_9DINO|nr:unnamed protein product [Effrenium voratum]CAJ1370335.1 unnamed protein product [Effrenium voratum]